MRPTTILTVLAVLTLVGCAWRMAPPAAPWGDLPADRPWIA